MSTKRSLDPSIRRCQRVLAMVHELHKRGFQRLRIVPGFNASGTSWRCTVTPVANVLKSHGAMPADYSRDTAHYTSAQGNRYFDWRDAKRDSARALADKFIDRFAGIVEQGTGADWPYAGWYVQMLGLAELGHLPVAYADWYEPPDLRWLPTTGEAEVRLPMPPPGEADEP